MWTLLLLALSLVSCAGADQSMISPKLKRLREASEPYSWAHLARGTNKQPGVVDVGRMPGTSTTRRPSSATPTTFHGTTARSTRRSTATSARGSSGCTLPSTWVRSSGPRTGLPSTSRTPTLPTRDT